MHNLIYSCLPTSRSTTNDGSGRYVSVRAVGPGNGSVREIIGLVQFINMYDMASSVPTYTCNTCEHASDVYVTDLVKCHNHPTTSSYSCWVRAAFTFSHRPTPAPMKIFPTYLEYIREKNQQKHFNHLYCKNLITFIPKTSPRSSKVNLMTSLNLIRTRIWILSRAKPQ